MLFINPCRFKKLNSSRHATEPSENDNFLLVEPQFALLASGRDKAINAKISRKGVVPDMVQILNHIEISEVEFKNNSHDTTSDYNLEIVIYD